MECRPIKHHSFLLPFVLTLSLLLSLNHLVSRYDSDENQSLRLCSYAFKPSICYQNARYSSVNAYSTHESNQNVIFEIELYQIRHVHVETYTITLWTHTNVGLYTANSTESWTHTGDYSIMLNYYFTNHISMQSFDKWSIAVLTRMLQKSSWSTRVWSFKSRNLSHLLLILLLSGQIEMNPGPKTSAYPCGVCQNEVDNNAQALLCDQCNFWCHTHCVGLSEANYATLVNTSGSFSWICYRCECPNFHSSLFETKSFELSNPFSLLTDLENDSNISHNTHPLTSTPTKESDQSFRLQPPKNRGKKMLKGMIINCNGLKSNNKQAVFRAALDQHDPDIVFGCESKIDQGISTYSIFPENFSVYRKDRDSNGGGVFIATKDTLISADLPDTNSDCEIVWASLQFASSKPLYLASYYGPQTQKNKAIDELAKSLSNVNTKCRGKLPNIILGGDFNLPDINWDSWTPTKPSTASVHQKFLDFLLENSLSQLVAFITRPVSNSILDLLATTNPQLISNLQPSPGISDHHIVTFNINMKPKQQPKPPRKIYNFKKADTETLKKKVNELTQEFLTSCPEKNCVDTNWEFLRDNLQDIMDSTVPSKLSKGKRHLPWITTDLKRKMRKRDALYKKALHTHTGNGWATFRAYRNMVTKLVQHAHNNYVNNIIGDSLVEQPKKFWSYVKLMCTENLGIPTLRTTSKLCTTDQDKAEALNTHFQSVFTQESKDSIPDKGKSPFQSIPNLHIETAGVEKQLLSLNPTKACGPDELSPRLLRTVAHEFAPALCFLFQQSYDHGTIPSQWKQALVTGIFKKGPKSDPANYRPISLTCLCCKVMEHIVLSHIAKHLSANKILLDSRHGFRQRLSTVTQLITSTHDWASTLQHRGQTDVILLDFSKAFDKVPHLHLSAKLNHYGIRGQTLDWIRSFLDNRTQAVSVNGTHSSWGKVSSGVPQGSVLGPALFLLYINDIQDHIQSTMRLFADDSIVYREIVRPEDHDILQQDLQALATWSSTWLMQFNIKKCAILTITRKRTPSHHQYKIFGETLERVD